MEVRVLEPLEVIVLARLVTGRGQPIAADQLRSAVWGDDRPPDAGAMLDDVIDRLRATLGSDAIHHAADGYALGAVSAVDIERVESSLASAEDAVAEGRLDEAARLFADALSHLRDAPAVTTSRPALADRRRAAVRQRHPTVTLVATSAGSIQELRREFRVTDVAQSRRRSARARRPASEMRRDVVVVCLLGLVACAQLALATAFLPWRVVAAGAGAVVADGFHDDAFRGGHWPYGGEIVATIAALMTAGVGLLAVWYARTGRRALAIWAGAVGGLGATTLGIFSVLAIEELAADGDALADSAVGIGLKVLLAVALIAIGLAVIAAFVVRGAGSSGSRGRSAGRSVAVLETVTAAIVLAVVLATDSTTATAVATPVAGVPRDSATIASTALTAPPAPTVVTALPPATASTAPTSTLFPTPEVQESFAAIIPDVAGYELTPAGDVLWPVYDLPGGAQAVAMNVGRNGATVAQLVVAGRPEPNALFSTYARRLFNGPVPISVEGMTPLGHGSLRLSSHDSLAGWRPISDAAVISATLPDRDAGQWVWQHRELIWVVRGRLVAERFVTQLIDEQRADIEAYDLQGLTGRLLDRFPRLPGVIYYDAPRRDTLGAMDDAWSWPCADAFHLSFVPAADDASPGLRDDQSLTIEISSVGQACEDAGFLDQLRAELAGRSELRLDDIAGREVYRSAVDVIHIDGDVVIHLSTANPATMRDVAGLVERFIAEQPT